MTLQQFSEFLYGAVLLDWDAERERMAKIKEIFDDAAEVRIVGEGTDLTLSLAGRHGEIDAAGANIPGGEVFYCPVEDSAEGVIVVLRSSPRCTRDAKSRVSGCASKAGTIVDALRSSNEEFLLSRPSTRTTARGGSASSASAATPASRAT